MKKQMYLMVAALMLFLIFLVSCGQQAEQSALENYKKGVAELQISLLDNAPPDKIYPNTPFKIIVKADNQAAYDIVDGRLTLVGTDGQYFVIPELSKDMGEGGALEGRSITNPAGGKQFIEFDANARDLYLNAAEQTSTYFLKARYRSTLDFAETICLNSNLYAVYDAGCKVEGRKSYSGQGAPLAVAELEEIMIPGTPGQVELRLHLRNKGKGRVEWIELGEASLGGEKLENCVFKEKEKTKRIEFKEKEKQEATVICRKNISGQASYTTTLVVSVAYGYELRQEHRLRLVR